MPPLPLTRSSTSEEALLAPLCIGVAGGTGSGKTTVAREIVRRVGADRIAEINQDRYYRDLSHFSAAHRARHNFDHPSAIEEELFLEHIALLKGGQPAPAPLYDFTAHTRRPAVDVIPPRPVILVEGILVLAMTEVRRLLDVKIYVDTDPDLRFIRRLQRDLGERGREVEGVIAQYLNTVRPMHLEFVEPSKRWADVIIPEGGFNTVALDLVISHIKQMLEPVDSRASSM
jgi:uridine kinase